MAVKNGSKDAIIMTNLLSDMGIQEYEPRVINQLIDFSYRYVSELLEEAKAFSLHLGKKSIDSEDIKMAAKIKMENTFTTPPPRELLLEVSKTKNALPLPAIKPFSGPKLPPDRYCLTGANYQLVSKKTSSSSTFSNKPLSTTRFPPNPTSNLSSLQVIGQGANVILKRKREEDDFQTV